MSGRGWVLDPHSGGNKIPEAIRREAVPLHLCRLRYFAPDRWSLAFYTYSNERYEPAAFHNGTFFGTPEEGIDIGAVYLKGR